MLESQDLVPIAIEDEMKRSYLDYAMSVIVSRALPDVRDGLKPVHRRILYAMMESGCDYNKPYRKSARIVGEVMGKYHPHGDAAIYDSLVRMAQDFSLRLPLIDGQGNFGSMDGDAPAAMRYTESRLAKVAHSLLENINENTVDFRPNYDGSEEEPVVIPAQFPNLLVNGAGGIAVGMATNIPPHNLGEVIDACCAYIDNTDITFEEIGEIIKGPDFPTGGTILGVSGIKSAIATGRGSIIMRGKTHFEQTKEGKQAVIITEVPYQVNKAKLVERIAELVREKKIEGITDLRDESDKSGVRVVIEVRRDAFPEVILNQLYSYTPLQTSFGVNLLALDNGRPVQMNIKEVIAAFIEFREIVITRRTKFRLNKVRDRAHILIGLATAVSNIDEVIALIKAAPDPHAAKEQLMNKNWSAENIISMINIVERADNLVTVGETIKLTEEQAKAILEMRLQRLTGLEHKRIHDELEEIAAHIKDYMDILSSRERLMSELKQELIKVKEEFATPRRTEIEFSEFEHDIEDLIPREDMVVIVTAGGYIKRVPLSTYRAQKRGGKGKSTMTMHEEDMTTDIFVASTHAPVLFFSSTGRVYRLKVYKLPIGSAQAKGRALVNIFPLSEGEKITNVMVLPEDQEDWKDKHIVFVTSFGNVRRNDICDFENIPSNGKIAMKLEEGDQLIGVALCNDDNHILLCTYLGKAVRFPVEKVRVFKGRTSVGVRGIRLAEHDSVISMSVLVGAEADMEERSLFTSITLDLRKQIAKSPTDEELLTQVDKEIFNSLGVDKITKFAEQEQFLLTVTENGFGKRTSAYEYRVTNRGGQGITNIVTSERNGNVIASLPVEDGDQIMLLTNKGKVIRCPVHDIRVSGRNTQGVKLFTTNNKEVVVSAIRIIDGASEEGEENNEEGIIDNPILDNPTSYNSTSGEE
ncbi:MAG: DNA gyrase subunit A [Sphingobacteriia bacterium]|nr:DNA gyrase subunit A [Sphingobacteriia bacterium]